MFCLGFQAHINIPISIEVMLNLHLISPYMLWSECFCLHKFIYWNQIPSVMAFGGRAFGRWSNPGTEALVNGLSVLRREAPEAPSSLLPCEVIAKKMANQESGSGSSPDTEYTSILILDFTASGTIRNKFLLFINHPIYIILLQQSEWTKAVYFCIWSTLLVQSQVAISYFFS